MTEQDIFIDKVKDGAIAGWHEGRILPSVTIAQACLESGWGTSELAKSACNLFGIKAKLDWKGESYTVRTAEYDKQGKKYYINAAFRKYRTWQDSLVDHAKFFHEGWREDHYTSHGVIGQIDYKKACKGLQSAGYATSQEYASQLIGLIEMYKLYKYDTVAKNKESEVESMVAFKYRQITNSKQMGRRRNKTDIKFIVVHWTSNQSPTATAMNHYRYLQTATRYGSAHYFVDEKEIVQAIGDTTEAWSVGDNQGYGRALNGCTNYNSISVEMCVNNGYSSKMLFNTIELVKELLRLYPNARVCRHWDVSRKECPYGYHGQNNAKWNNFLEEIKKPRRLILDLSKDSVAKEVKASTPQPQPKLEQPKTSKVTYDLVTYSNEIDKVGADMITQNLHIPALSVANYEKHKEKYRSIIHVGGSGAPQGAKVLAGANRYDTYDLVEEFIKNYNR